MARYVVARVDEIPPGHRKIVRIARRSVGVFNVDGTFLALRNQCPHSGGPLCKGTLSGLVTSDRPGSYTYLRRGEILRCPWHGWEFDLRTGRSWFDPAKTRVRSYHVRVESNTAVLEINRGGTTTHNEMNGPIDAADKDLVEAGYVPGPYAAEMYNVAVERKYVIVEI